MKPIKVRNPALSVTLLKNVGRAKIDNGLPVSTRYSGQKKTVDLTPYFGDMGSVRVSKSVREPAGAFVLTFADKIDQDAQDTVYGLVEPMDVIEIRIAGDAYLNANASGAAKPPVMMRGFVSNVRRSETMQDNGEPQRAVIISGQDYGKIWQILQVFFMPNAPQGDNLITSFPFFARYGLSFKTMPAQQFVQEVFQKVINPYIAEMASQGGNDPKTSPLLQIKTDMQVTDGNVSPFGIGGWMGGTIYSLLAQHCDQGVWNEIFIEDREDAPYVVYRPNPFTSVDGKTYIMPVEKGKEPKFVTIGRDDVVSIVTERSDTNVANYFWVDAPRFNLNYVETLRAMSYQGAPQTFFVENYGNVNPKLYGTRKMWEQTAQGGDDETNSGNGTPDGQPRRINEAAAIAWMNLRRQQLIDQNKDNVVLENGTMRLKGNENIRSGTYVRLNSGNMQSNYYAVNVQHDYVPFGSYLTTVSFERGRGFIDRVQKGGGKASPYWAELADGS